MTIRAKLVTAMVVAVAGLALTAGVGIWGMNSLGDKFDDVREAVASMQPAKIEVGEVGGEADVFHRERQQRVVRIAERGLGEPLSVFALTVWVQRIALELAQARNVSPDRFRYEEDPAREQAIESLGF